MHTALKTKEDADTKTDYVATATRLDGTIFHNKDVLNIIRTRHM